MASFRSGRNLSLFSFQGAMSFGGLYECAFKNAALKRFPSTKIERSNSVKGKCDFTSSTLYSVEGVEKCKLTFHLYLITNSFINWLYF